MYVCVSISGGVTDITKNATCTASCPAVSGTCSPCDYAIDGNRYSTSWNYIGTAVGAWLQIVFDRTYDVSLLKIALHYWADQRAFKDVMLTFSDGSTHMVNEIVLTSLSVLLISNLRRPTLDHSEIKT